MTERRAIFTLIPSETESAVLRADFEDQSPFQVFVFENRAKLDRVLLAIGLPLLLSPGNSDLSCVVTPGQLRDLLEYSECPYPCCNAGCRCFHHA